MSSELPNRFILNSDYMSLAQASNYETNIVLPTGRATNYVGLIDKDIPLPTVKGAMARYLVSYGTSVYNMDTGQDETRVVALPTTGVFWIYSQTGTPSWQVFLSRKDANTLNVYAIVRTSGASDTYPSITFKLNVSYMYPPNL